MDNNDSLQEVQVTTKRIPTDDTYVNSRDFRIKDILLINSEGKPTSIVNLVMEVQVRQDLYLGFINGELLITDAIDLYSQMAFHGNEYIFIHLEEPQQQVLIRKAFRIYKIGNRVNIQNNAQRYIIYFVSDELVTSNTKKISKAYKSSTISEIAKDILLNHLMVPENKIDIDESSGMMNIIIPNYRPSEALNWLATRAFNDQDTCYFFYEDLEGFKFKSLQNLFQQPTINKNPFVLQNKMVTKDVSVDKLSIDYFESKRDFDVLSTVSSGGYALKVLGVDLFYQNLNKNEFGIDGIKKLYENPAMSNPKDDTGKPLFERYDTHYLTYLQAEKTLTDEKNYSETWLKRIMTLASLNNSLMELAIPGDINLQVGKIVDLLFPYTITPSESDMWDKRKSGKYLIIAVNHKFDIINHLFNSMIMVTRDSIPEALPPLDADLPAKIAKLNNL